LSNDTALSEIIVSIRSRQRNSNDCSAGESSTIRERCLTSTTAELTQSLGLLRSVSLLTDFEECSDYLDWTLDKHGIYVQFANPLLSFPSLPPSSSSSSTPSTASTPSTGSSDALSSTTPSYRSLSSLPQLSLSLPRSANPKQLKTVLHATFLPDVAVEQGWSKVDAVNAAIRKAGYKGPVTEELRKQCKVSRYQSKKVKADYQEWVEWRKGQGLGDP